MKPNLLVITSQAFHNNVGNGGGKVLNYYYRQFINSEEFNIEFIFTGDQPRDLQIMLEQFCENKFYYNSSKKLFILKGIDFFLFRYWYPFVKKFIPDYYITNGYLKRRLSKLLAQCSERFKPNIIILEFPPIIFCIDVLLRYFPDAKVIASCHDITSQGVERMQKINNPNFFGRWYYQKFLTLEKAILKKFDLCVVLSDKDKQLLIEQINIPAQKVLVVNPFYDKYIVDNNQVKDGILYFGAMSRQENYLSVLWFLEHVWSKNDSNTLKLYIVGGGVKNDFEEQCKAYNNVIITGFITDPSIYFSKSFAMVVPLQFGAGIKIKTIEALNSGVPVISNKIGMEGIPAKANEDYIHCEAPEEWINAIDLITTDTVFRQNLLVNAIELVNTNFNLQDSFLALNKKVLNLLNL